MTALRYPAAFWGIALIACMWTAFSEMSSLPGVIKGLWGLVLMFFARLFFPDFSVGNGGKVRFRWALQWHALEDSRSWIVLLARGAGRFRLTLILYRMPLGWIAPILVSGFLVGHERLVEALKRHD